MRAGSKIGSIMAPLITQKDMIQNLGEVKLLVNATHGLKVDLKSVL